MSKTLSPCFLATRYGKKSISAKCGTSQGLRFQIDLLGPSDGFRLAPGSGIAQIQVSAFRLRPPAFASTCRPRQFARRRRRAAADACAHPANTCGRPARSAFSRKRRPVSQPFPANLARRWATSTMPSAARTFAKTERRAVPFSCAVRAPRDRLQGLLAYGILAHRDGGGVQ